jgi:hypothetical protein
LFAADLDDFLGVLGLAVDYDMKIEVFVFLAAKFSDNILFSSVASLIDNSNTNGLLILFC